jgi:hypothetical protein
MKILFTGMSTSHAKENSRQSFFASLREVYKNISEVETIEPSITMTKEYLDSYDAIFVGVIPPTSPSANYLYGAMHLINTMYDSPKLYVVVDNDQLWNYKTGFSSIARDVTKIFTPFLNRRKEFTQAKNNKAESIQQAAQKMATMQWPKTIYPALPWGSKANLDDFIGHNRYPVNLDIYLLTEPKLSLERHDAWYADQRNPTWVKKLTKLIDKKVYPVKETRRDPESVIEERVASALGLIIPPVERGVGTWWSQRYIQALNSLTPISTEWKESRVISDYWNLLAVNIEELTTHDRLEVAKKQREAYVAAIPSKNEVLETLTTFITTLNKEIR